MNVENRLGRSDQPQELEIKDVHARPPLSLPDIWRVARMRVRVILGAAATVFVLIALAVLSLTPLYKGSATVMIDTRENKVVDVEAVLSGLPTDQTSIFNQVQILQSRELAARVIDKLRLDRDPEFNPSLARPWWQFLSAYNPILWLPHNPAPPDTPEQRRRKLKDAEIDRFESRLGVSQIQLSTALQIDFESKIPANAARIANAIADAYVEDQLNAKFEATVKATQWLAGRLGQLADQSRKAQAAVEKYKADNHITEVVSQNGTGLISVLDQQIAAVNAQLVQSDTDVAQAEANLARVRALVSSGRAADVSQVVGSALIGQLIEQQAALIQKQAEWSTRYGPNHPKMLDLQAEKRDLDAKIREEISHVVGTAENDLAVARAREGALRTDLARLEAQSTVQGEARVKLRELEANAASSQALYDNFVSRSKETQQQVGLQIPDARVISWSPIPVQQSFPNTRLVLEIALIAALFTGFILAFFLERIDNGFRTTARVEEALGFPVLATLPDLAPAKGLRARGRFADPVNAADFIVDKPLSSYAEAIRALQLGIALSHVDRMPEVVLVTSALPGEGKTTTAVSLARHLAQIGRKVALIDADLRRPTVKSITRLGEHPHDLIQVLKREATIDQALVKDAKSRVMVLPVLDQVKNAPDLIESQAMARLIDDLRLRFDFVILDSAPILPVTDSRILARLADTVVFVVRWEKTAREAASDAARMLRDAHASVAGVALARADTKRFNYYSFGYSGQYYSYSKYYEA